MFPVRLARPLAVTQVCTRDSAPTLEEHALAPVGCAACSFIATPFGISENDNLQISIDNVQPDEVSKKSLKVLDRKLEWLKKCATFDVTINSVLGSAIAQPEDAYAIAVRARALGP